MSEDDNTYLPLVGPEALGLLNRVDCTDSLSNYYLVVGQKRNTKIIVVSKYNMVCSHTEFNGNYWGTFLFFGSLQTRGF